MWGGETSAGAGNGRAPCALGWWPGGRQGEARALGSQLAGVARVAGPALGAHHGEEGRGDATRSPLGHPPRRPAPLPPLCQHWVLSRSFSPLCFQTGSARLSVTCCRVPGWRSEVSVSPRVAACGAHRKPSPRRAPWGSRVAAWSRCVGPGREPAGGRGAVTGRRPGAAQPDLQLRAAAGPACIFLVAPHVLLSLPQGFLSNSVAAPRR